MKLITKNWWCSSFAIVRCFSHVKHIKELLTRKVTRKWFQRFQPMHKNHSISMIQKVFSRCRASGTSTKVIYKPNRIMLQRHRRTARLQNNHRFKVVINQMKIVNYIFWLELEGVRFQFYPEQRAERGLFVIKWLLITLPVIYLHKSGTYIYPLYPHISIDMTIRHNADMKMDRDGIENVYLCDIWYDILNSKALNNNYRLCQLWYY